MSKHLGQYDGLGGPPIQQGGAHCDISLWDGGGKVGTDITMKISVHQVREARTVFEKMILASNWSLVGSVNGKESHLEATHVQT